MPNKLFGGKIVIFLGDLKQIFPVVPYGMPTNIVKGPTLHVIWLCVLKFIFILIDKINHFYWLLMPKYYYWFINIKKSLTSGFS